MTSRVLPSTAIAALFLGALVSAQDSVSNVGFSIPGDAANVWDASDQSDTYVVELAPFKTDWGTTFGIAPILKSRRASSFFGSDLISAQAISATLLKGVPYAASNYAIWRGLGKGVRAVVNDSPDAFVTPTGSSTQFAIGMSSFGTTDNGFSENNVYGAVVNFNPRDPRKLYVHSVSAAVNGLNQNENRSQYGFGNVDATGNIYFRADGFNATGPNALTDDNIFRVDLLARNTSIINLIDNSGAADPISRWIVQNSATVHSTPTCLPESIFGRPVYAGATFNGEYATEPVPGFPAYTTAVNNCNGGTRGSLAFSKTQIFPGTLGTCTLMAQDFSATTNSILAFGVTFNGIPAGGSICATIPTSITDNHDGNIVNVYRSQSGASQVPFRGGNGQVTLGKDQLGNILMAFTVTTADLGVANNEFNAIVVAKVDPVTHTVVDWTTAAYIDQFSAKGLEDGNGLFTGQLITLGSLTGGVPNGPSIAIPMMDSVGNIWFEASIERFLPGGGTDPDTALVRAVYDPATFSYSLERVIDVGQTFRGMTSCTPYQISFMSIADSNSIGSSAAFSHNIVQSAYNDRSTANLQPRDARTLGGLVFTASITYDSDRDGVFDVNLGFDERYSVLLYLGYLRTYAGGLFNSAACSD